MTPMGISSITHTGRFVDWSLFTDPDPSGGTLLHAVVVCRGQRKPAAHRARSPFPNFIVRWLFRTGLLQVVWRRGSMALALGSFKAADALLAGKPQPPDARWTSSVSQGDYLIGYDRRRGIVGFRGREFGPAPEGHAVLLLVEDDASAPDGVTIIERIIPVTPMPPKPPVDRSGSKEEILRRLHAQHRAEQALWSAMLEADPEYQRFIARSEPGSAPLGDA